MDTTFEAIGPNRNTRDGRSRRFDRVSALGSRVARWIVAAAAIGLTALSVALAAPASAHGSHDAGDIRHHLTTTSAVQEQPTSNPSTGVNAGSTPWSRQMQSAEGRPTGPAMVQRPVRRMDAKHSASDRRKFSHTSRRSSGRRSRPRGRWPRCSDNAGCHWATATMIAVHSFWLYGVSNLTSSAAARISA